MSLEHEEAGSGADRGPSQPALTAESVAAGGLVAADVMSLAANIVSQLFDLAEVPVEKRQAINDAADSFVVRLLAARPDVRALLDRIDALEGLLVCYRIGKNPTEALHQKLDRTRVEWHRIREQMELVELMDPSDG